jgi:hypothetical protein
MNDAQWLKRHRPAEDTLSRQPGRARRSIVLELSVEPLDTWPGLTRCLQRIPASVRRAMSDPACEPSCSAMCQG